MFLRNAVTVLALITSQCLAARGPCPVPHPRTNVTVFPPLSWNITDTFCFEPKSYNEDPKWNVGFMCLDKEDRPSFNLARPPDCATFNNQDYYGFGVRLGFYFTWFGSWYANQFAIGEVSGALDASSIFLFALEVAVYKGVRDNSFQKVDAVIMLLIGAGTTIGTMSIWGYRTAYYRREGRTALRHFGGLGTHVRLVLCLGVNAFWLWFWMSPFERQLGLGTCDPRCRAAYIFNNLLITDVHWVLFAFGLVPMVYWGAMLLVSPIALFAWLRNIWHNEEPTRLDQTTKLSYDTGLTDAELRRRSYLYMVLSAIWLIFILILIEVTLHQNSALGTLASSPNTSTPAQLIPLLIGVTSFVRIVYISWREGRFHSGEGASPSQPKYQSLERYVQENGISHAKSDKDAADYGASNAAMKESAWSRRFWHVVGRYSPGYHNASYKLPRSKQKGEQSFEPRPFLRVRLFLVTWLPWLGLMHDFVKLETAAQGAQSQVRIV